MGGASNISPAEGTQVVNGFQDQALVMRFCLLLCGFFHWKLVEVDLAL
jgi:hypothetical protein